MFWIKGEKYHIVVLKSAPISGRLFEESVSRCSIEAGSVADRDPLVFDPWIRDEKKSENPGSRRKISNNIFESSITDFLAKKT